MKKSALVHVLAYRCGKRPDGSVGRGIREMAQVKAKDQGLDLWREGSQVVQ